MCYLSSYLELAVTGAAGLKDRYEDRMIDPDMTPKQALARLREPEERPYSSNFSLLDFSHLAGWQTASLKGSMAPQTFFGSVHSGNASKVCLPPGSAYSAYDDEKR